MIAFIAAFFIALAPTLAGLPWVRRAALALELVDAPAQRKIHRTPMPLLGGAAIFLGAIAAVLIIYRGGMAEMPAWAGEVEMTFREGTEFMLLTAPKRIIGGKKVEAVECVKMRLGPNDASGRPRPIPIPGSEFFLEADTVILALGQRADTHFLRAIPGMSFNDDVVEVDPHSLMTAVPGIFAGGDAVPSDRTVTIGVGHGKKAARRIDAWLNKEEWVPVEKHPVVTLPMKNLWYYGDHERHVHAETDNQKRIDVFTELVASLTDPYAAYAAAPCLLRGK